MGELTSNCPKPMLPVAGKPLLQHILEFLSASGVTDFILAARYKAEIIEQYFSAEALGARFPVRIHVEDQPMGTAGSLPALAPLLDDNFVLYYGDELADFRLAEFASDHLQHSPLATILVRPSHHPWDGHLIQVDASGDMTEFATHLQPGRLYQNRGNLGIYVLNREILHYIEPRKMGFVEDVFPKVLEAGGRIRVHELESSGYVKDVGTPQRIDEVETFLRHRSMIEAARSNRQPVETVFLDRDGVLVEDLGLVRRKEDVRLLPGAAEGLRLLNEHGLRTVMVTNQPVVARGLCTEEDLAEIHAELARQLAVAGAHWDALYYCPHHPETHYGEGVVKLRRGCDCRKPRAGMLLRAADELKLNLGASVMVGDSSVDVEAGQNAGVRTVLVETGKQRIAAGGPKADYVFPGLLEAARAIVSGGIR